MWESWTAYQMVFGRITAEGLIAFVVIGGPFVVVRVAGVDYPASPAGGAGGSVVLAFPGTITA